MAHFRFVHAADLHLDSPFRGLGSRSKMPDEIYQRIKQSTFRAFDHLIKLCIEERADFLVIAGDVFDLRDRSLRAQTYFQKGLKRLAQEGIQVYVIHGNHDPEDGGKASLSWPDNTTFFSSQAVESAAFVKNGEEAARIYGRSYPTAQFTERIIDQYIREPDVPFAIALLHTNLDGDPDHDNYAPCSRSELLEKDFDYWALGHIHQRAVIHEKEPAIVYAGNIQGRSIKETGARGCYVVDVRNGDIISLTFRETDDVRWYHEQVDVSGMDRIQQVFDRIQELFQDISDKSSGRPSIIRLELVGVTSVHQQLFPVDDFMEGLEPYIEEFFAQENWVWPESIRIRTRPAVSREELLASHGFVGDFLRMVDEIRQNPDERTLIKEEILKDLYRHRDGKKHLSLPTDDELDEWLGEVENMAVRLFYRNEEETS
ncbi:MAG: DNA repair exonuclease [Bacillaceae bacterium]|nr:DNA repair exonuclease [Bacillaceae bacterium]